MTLRPITPIKLPPDVRPARDLGPRGRLVELPVSALVIDETYQRDVRAGGRSNILRIVESFDWRRFGVLVVTPVDDGKYAVIDGQHRATAALMHPKIDLVPALVIEADVATSAQVFASLTDIVAANKVWLERDLVVLLAKLRLGDLIAKASAEATERRTIVRTVLIAHLERAMKEQLGEVRPRATADA